MKTYKQIGIFLLLGVMLVGLLICGCTPVQQTEDTTGAPEPDTDSNAIAFRDLPGVNMDNIDKISIYYGSVGNQKLIQTLDSAEATAEFRATFEQLRLTMIDSPSTLSSLMPATEEYLEAFKRICDKTTYRIVIEYGDEKQWEFYIVESKRAYYMDDGENIYISAGEVEYIDVIGLGRVLNQSYIEGCTYAGVTKSLNDSATHTLFGEENVTAFFDTFFTGLVLTDNGARIKQVQANTDSSGFPFQICFTRNESASLLVCFYENGAITVNYGDYEFASVQDNVVDKQAMEQWLKEHDAL